jgi:hypothetical protein
MAGSVAEGMICRTVDGGADADGGWVGVEGVSPLMAEALHPINTQRLNTGKDGLMMCGWTRIGRVR